MRTGQVTGMRSSGDMLQALEALVVCESPSSDPAATTRCLEVAAGLIADWLGEKPRIIESDGRRHDLYTFGQDGAGVEILLLAHVDTVWPTGTLAEIPFAVTDGIVRGPGVFDMKAGLVQGLAALTGLERLDGIGLLLTTDEEVGSPTSQNLIQTTAKGARAVFVLEPGVAGALKTERKGVSMYEVNIAGKAAHAGLEPEKGVNALIELAHLVLGLEATARPQLGTTVTPTVAAAGTTRNSVPESASVLVDVRATTAAEQDRVHAELTARAAVLAGASIEILGGPNRPPLERTASAALFERAAAVARRLGQPELREVSVGGGSDGNFTAGMGIPTLDGLGAIGDGAHARHEHVVADTMAPRAELLKHLIADLQTQP
ncbi:MAG TPA: M20 family metallopeptidase [Acidimicrobiales bacterium]|nr:M20 family metallopeptidase [Acidimicrobiales bacterium]